MYKEYFPYFKNSKNIYLDNAATTQKPLKVIEAITDYYTNYCSNTHRSIHGDANKATTLYENSRKMLQKSINAESEEQIIFTKGVTESINFVASSFGKKIKTIIISSLEHHSNIVPWHMQGRTIHKGLEVVEVKEDLSFDYDNFIELLKNNPNSLVSILHVSNSFGIIHDIKKIAKLTHQYGSYILVDGAQSLPHFSVDVQDLDVDFYAISAHKAFGPTGVGALYVKKELLNDLEVYQTGGATINDVTYERSELLPSPFRYEAGTQNIAGVIGFGKALEFINEIGYKSIHKKEKELYDYLYKSLKSLDNIIIYGNMENSIGSISFNINGINCDDIGILLDKMHIAVRVGHHCVQPIMKKLGIKGTIRVSISFYNDKEDIDRLVDGLKKAIKMLGD